MRTTSVARHLSVSGLIALATVTGCQRSRSSNGVSDSAFVAVLADLKRVQGAPGMSPSQRAASRDSILQIHGLKPAQLEQAAKQLAENPARAQTVWQAVQQRAADTSKAARKAPK